MQQLKPCAATGVGCRGVDRSERAVHRRSQQPLWRTRSRERPFGAARRSVHECCAGETTHFVPAGELGRQFVATQRGQQRFAATQRPRCHRCCLLRVRSVRKGCSRSYERAYWPIRSRERPFGPARRSVHECCAGEVTHFVPAGEGGRQFVAAQRGQQHFAATQSPRFDGVSCSGFDRSERAVHRRSEHPLWPDRSRE